MGNIQIPFTNREEELELLENLYLKASKEAQFLVLYGKRRVGKTELVKHFFKDKPHIYYLASRISARDQLKTASNVVADYFDEPYFKETGFNNWRDFFSYLGTKLKQSNKKLVLVFDEFPYLVESEPGMSSFFQSGWDEYLKDCPVMLIIMGSSISMMYKHALKYNAPLYGRRTASYILEPFSFTQSKNFYQTKDFEKVFSFYAISGGIPAYLKEFDEQKTIWENIADKVLTKGTLFYSEPELIISDELREPRKYLTILKAIGCGRTKFAEILNTGQLEAHVASKYLSVLMDLHFVKREVPITEKNPERSKKGIYFLADGFFRFYYSFIFPYLSALESRTKSFFLEKIKEEFPFFISKIYEDTTREFIPVLWEKGLLPKFPLLGRWWDKNNEIDLLGLNKKENAILFVETKYNQTPISNRVLQKLKKKASQVKWGSPKRKEYYALVAKGGFSEDLLQQAKREDVFLIQEDKLIKL